MPTPATLARWLEYIERIHPKSIELGLERVRDVKHRLGLESTAVIVTVAGTNGKGSTCAMLESILLAAGYRVGMYSSPHLLAYNERVRINGAPVGDASLCRAFEQVETARGGVALTYFEFGTLAAWVIFAGTPLDALILEVGMGGRLDAVNSFDADCAVLTSIAIDHTDYLGHTREQIGLEKAGIFRTGRPAIVGDPEPPASVIGHAKSLGADLQRLGHEFGCVRETDQWTYWGSHGRQAGLAYPALHGSYQLNNASACLAALDAIAGRLPVSADAVRRGLATVRWPGRFQVLRGRPVVVLDVAHNPQAAEMLARNLAEMGSYPMTYAVFGMLQDKDIEGVCAALKGKVDAWYAATLGSARGAPAQALARAIRSSDPSAEVTQFDSPRSAFAAACKRARGDARIIVFGSFLTVAEVMAAQDPG